MAPSKGEEFTHDLEVREKENLKPYALRSGERRERLAGYFREGEVRAPLEYRTEYHRDRDRIVWSKSFKRLQHKTQVFPHYVEDHYRRRLTHSLEVAQIATTIARSLRLNEIATEAMALGHDLGHAPFGHAGEKALHGILKAKCEKMKVNASDRRVPICGFDHCVHAIEVVSRIEEEYKYETKHGGLNLTFDVRDGILKHMYDRSADPEKPLSNIGSVTKIHDYEVYRNNKGSLEGQCVYFADKVAYLLGDIEDGLRSNILKCADVIGDQFFQVLSSTYGKIRGNGEQLSLKDVKEFPSFRSKILTVMILDCINQATTNIDAKQFKCVDDVFDCDARLIRVSDTLDHLWTEFYREWMEGKMFKHENVVACGFKAKEIVTALFNTCYDDIDLINRSYREHCQRAYADVCDPDEDLFKLILVRNYVAGMTDSFAIQQHARLFMSSERVSV
jgi:dGTPase